MVKVWLLIAIVVFTITTYMCITDDYRQWMYYYAIVGIALVMYFVKRYMMKRMEKHLEFLEQEKRK